MKAYIFPGQGAQFPGMGKDLYQANNQIKSLIDQADQILGFELSKIMFEGSEEELKQTKVTQPAIFLHSIAVIKSLTSFKPDMVAGHSLGEFSALVANECLRFEDALQLVFQRALAMQKACELQPSTMAAILGLEDDVVEKICSQMPGVVIPANYNSPGQLVISGEIAAVTEACEKLKEAGAKRALLLPVGGAFHSPLMDSAKLQLQAAIEKTSFHTPICPIYQNVDAKPYTDSVRIKENLIKQLTAPVRWTQTVQNMIGDGATEFIEAGPGKVLQGLVKKINREMVAESA